MNQAATARKLPDDARFVDLSDYARPLAVWIARRLQATRVTAPAVTAMWALIGLGGAGCYALGGYPVALVGAAAIQIKNILDAVDGSLARLQNRPSRVGRFLDSISDAVIAAALAAAIGVAVARERPALYVGALATASLLLGLLQGSLYNYYYVRYRGRHAGDATSSVVEELTAADRTHYAGRPFARGLLSALVVSYKWIYAWQDALVQRIDRWAVGPLRTAGQHDLAEKLRDDRALLTAVSALGPGMHILVLDLYTIAGVSELALALELYLWTVALGGTLYATALVLRLRRAAQRLARRPAEQRD